MDKRIKAKIVRKLGRVEKHCFDHIMGASGFDEAFRMMKSYVKAADKIIREHRKKNAKDQ